MLGDECVHLRRVVFFIAEGSSTTRSKFKSTVERNCYDWLKKYTVIEVVARENGGCARQKGSFDGHNLQNGGHNLGHNHKLLYLCLRL